MKKFNRQVHNLMGSLPPALLKRVNGANVADATAQFNDTITKIAMDFIAQISDDGGFADIKLTAPAIFGMPVTLEYVASGSVGSVYKMQIGDDIFALKINRNASAGELPVIATQSRARNLLNKMYMGATFKYNNRKYSWVLSDYIAHDKENDFRRAMEKMYYAYLTKGISVSDAHPNNFKAGKLIDQATFGNRAGKIDDIKRLTRIEVDMVKKLVYYIKTDNVAAFTELMEHVGETNPAVVDYMFFAMKFGKSPMFGGDKTDTFSLKVNKFDAIVNNIYRRNNVQKSVIHKIKSGHEI